MRIIQTLQVLMLSVPANVHICERKTHDSYLVMRVHQRWAWTGSGLDILQDTCDFFGSGLNLDIYFWKKLDQDQDICLISMTKSSWEWFKMSQMMMLLFSLLWFLYSQKIKMVLSEGYVLHSSQSMIINLCYFIVKIFCRGESSKLLLNCWYAALLWWVAYVCVV